MNTPVLLSLGGNLGDVEIAFNKALISLKNSGFRVSQISEIYHSPALGCEEGAPDFLNLSVLGEWDSEPLDLLHLTQKIEAENGRPNKHPYHVSRPLDIDIIFFGYKTVNLPELKIPHPEFNNRDFVLIPSMQIAPELVSYFQKKLIS